MVGMVDHALNYAAAGIPVFPVQYPIFGDDGPACSCRLGADCKQMAKHPAVHHGHKNASLDPEVIRGLWRDRPFNVGAPTGNLFDVLDDDPARGGDDSLHALELAHGALPETARSRTGGGGWHFFYQHIEGVKNNNTGKVGLGLDFKTAGGYVVMPPSLHRSGLRYEWVDPGAAIVPAPGWMVELLREKFPTGRRARKPEGFWGKLAEGVEINDRHNAILSVAGLLLLGRSKIETRLAIRLIHGFNTECCDPPKPRDEVNSIISYILRK